MCPNKKRRPRPDTNRWGSRQNGCGATPAAHAAQHTHRRPLRRGASERVPTERVAPHYTRRHRGRVAWRQMRARGPSQSLHISPTGATIGNPWSSNMSPAAGVRSYWLECFRMAFKDSAGATWPCKATQLSNRTAHKNQKTKMKNRVRNLNGFSQDANCDVTQIHSCFPLGFSLAFSCRSGGRFADASPPMFTALVSAAYRWCRRCLRCYSKLPAAAAAAAAKWHPRYDLNRDIRRPK